MFSGDQWTISVLLHRERTVSDLSKAVKCTFLVLFKYSGKADPKTTCVLQFMTLQCISYLSLFEIFLKFVTVVCTSV